MNDSLRSVGVEKPRLHLERSRGRVRANADDASLWRWFASMMEQSRLRWRRGTGCWLVSLDHKHLSTERDFDGAMRTAKAASDYIYGPISRPDVTADAQDADLWRWFSLCMDEMLIRWYRAGDAWFVIVNHKHLSTETNFGFAIACAKVELAQRACGLRTRRSA